MVQDLDSAGIGRWEQASFPIYLPTCMSECRPLSAHVSIYHCSSLFCPLCPLVSFFFCSMLHTWLHTRTNTNATAAHLYAAPKVMCAWHFVKLAAAESHRKLLLTEAASPTAQHPTRSAESHCDFLYSVNLPSTPLWLKEGPQCWLSAATMHAVMLNHASFCVLLSGSVLLERRSRL